MRREAAAIKIQKSSRRQITKNKYTKQRVSALVIQTGLRAMVARNEFRYKRQAKASTIIEVK